jgi:AcrR family transcriptional regulator
MATGRQASGRMTAAQRRRQILDAAVRVFAERGHRSAALHEVAAMCGVTEPLLYRYFTTRKALMVAATEAATDQALADWERAAAVAHDGPAKLAAVARTAEAGDMASRSTQMLVQAQADGGRDPELSQAICEALARRVAFLRGLVEQTKREGTIPAHAQSEGIAWQVLSAICGCALASGDQGARPSPERMVNFVIRCASARPVTH